MFILLFIIHLKIEHALSKNLSPHAILHLIYIFFIYSLSLFRFLIQNP